MLKHTSPISSIANYKDKYIATAGYDNKVILWDAATNQAMSVGCHDHLVNQCVFSPCGCYLATASSDYTGRLWKIPEMRLLSVFPGHEDDVECMSFHSILPIIATSSQDKKIRVFDLNGTLFKEMQGHTADVISIA